MKKNNDNHQKEGTKMKQITNSEVTTDPVVDFKSEVKHDLAGLYSRVMEAPLS